ncbi:hypothetical protein MPER_01662, partial [Moniliophthora perniciosa FA553]
FAAFYDAGGENSQSKTFQSSKPNVAETVGAWEATFVYDAILFLLACYKAYQTRNEVGLPLMKVAIRDASNLDPRVLCKPDRVYHVAKSGNKDPEGTFSRLT